MYLKNKCGRVVKIPPSMQNDIKDLYRQGYTDCTQEEIEEIGLYQNSLDKKQIQFIWNNVAADGYGESGKRMAYLLAKRGYFIKAKKAKVSVTYLTPEGSDLENGKYKILYTMFESTDIPDSWKPKLKKYDLILVPSKFCKDAFGKHHNNVKVVNLGYNESIFKPISRPVKRDNFTFLHYNAFNIRKGFLEVWEAFTQEFLPDEPVRLLLKGTHPTNFPIVESKYPNIDVVIGRLSLQELRELIGRGDCFVFPSRGEGFGLTPLEAMATGIPAIVVPKHGIGEYYNPECMFGVDSKLCPSVYRKNYVNTGYMHEADIGSLRQAMRYAYENRQETYLMGKKAQEWTQNFTSSKTVDKLCSIIDSHL